MKYSEKLKDPRWQRKRLEVLNRDDFTCQACGDKKSTLAVHHKKYNGDPWAAAMDDLETLCENCHTKRGEANQKFLGLSSVEAIKIMEKIETDGVWNNDLMCNLISYESWVSAVSFHLPKFNSADMTGAIRLAKKISPKVDYISVYSGEKRNAIYSTRSGSVKWTSELKGSEYFQFFLSQANIK